MTLKISKSFFFLAFFNSSLNNVPYARSVTMSVHGDQVVVRISNDVITLSSFNIQPIPWLQDSEYLRSFNSWKEVNPDSEKQLFFSRDGQVFQHFSCVCVLLTAI